MEQRSIAGFKVSALGLGTSRLASLGAGGSLREAGRLLDAAADLGITFIDTADAYGSTQAERWLGELLAKRGGEFVVATKCGLPVADLPGPLRALNQPAKKAMQRLGPGHYLQPAHFRRGIDASLRRLRRERIEIFLVHEPPAGVQRMDELFAVLDKARAAGKIGAYGVCSQDAEVVAQVVESGRCAVMETAVEPLTSSRVQAALSSSAAGENVEFIANHVLGGSLGPAGDRAERVRRLIRHAAAVSQVRVVLTGTSSPGHLAENAAALDLPTTAEDLLT